MPALLLASSSPYRRELLDRLQLPFTWQSPSIDETRLAGETGIDLVRRLAEAKARALADQHPGHLIIGSDQVAILSDDQILGKPHDLPRAQQQLRAASGSSVTFLTGLALLDTGSG